MVSTGPFQLSMVVPAGVIVYVGDDYCHMDSPKTLSSSAYFGGIEAGISMLSFRCHRNGLSQLFFGISPIIRFSHGKHCNIGLLRDADKQFTDL